MTGPDSQQPIPELQGQRVLVVDDEPDIVAVIAYNLAKAGCRVSTAANGPQALHAVTAEHPALVVLDLMLPGMSGFEILEHLRARVETHDIPVLLLTARRDEPDRIRGLSLGADDYLTKPFSPQELVLRIGAVLRRVQRGPSSDTVRHNVIAAGPISIDCDANQVTVSGELIILTPLQYKLLLALVERRGRTQARTRLLETVWDASPDMQTRTIDTQVQRLREKLGAAGDLIETVRGFGYRLRREPSDESTS